MWTITSFKLQYFVWGSFLESHFLFASSIHRKARQLLIALVVESENMIPIDKESQSLIAPHFINFYPSGPVGCLGSSSHQACHLAAILIVTFNYIIVKFELCVSVNMQRKWYPKSQNLNINALLDKRQKHHIVISLFHFVWPPFPFPSFWAAILPARFILHSYLYNNHYKIKFE